MGVDFSLHQPKRKKSKKSRFDVPHVDAHFAFTEYPRFLRQLARDAGLESPWSRYTQACGTLFDKILEPLAAGETGDGKPPPTARELAPLRQGAEEAKKDIEKLADRDPLVEFLLLPTDSGTLDSEACGRIAPRIRAVVEKWEPAPEGSVGWREKGLELAAAMQFAAEHPGVVFCISG